jgi:hypothetical protein
MPQAVDTATSHLGFRCVIRTWGSGGEFPGATL